VAALPPRPTQGSAHESSHHPTRRRFGTGRTVAGREAGVHSRAMSASPADRPGAPESPGPPQPPVINIVGAQIALGPIRKDLVPTYHRWVSDYNTMRTLGNVPAPMLLEQEEKWFEQQIDGNPNTIHFTIYVHETWRPVGNVSLMGIDRVNRSATFGILIGEPDARGHGYGTEAARLMLDYAFTAQGLHSVNLEVYEYNLAGQRAYQKAGFKEAGRRRQAHFMGGKLWDVVIMDCLATEFESPVLAKILVPDVPR
jgi:diamine N-acetyltransferase